MSRKIARRPRKFNKGGNPDLLNFRKISSKRRHEKNEERIKGRNSDGPKTAVIPERRRDHNREEDSEENESSEIPHTPD